MIYHFQLHCSYIPYIQTLSHLLYHFLYVLSPTLTAVFVYSMKIINLVMSPNNFTFTPNIVLIKLIFLNVVYRVVQKNLSNPTP